MVIGLTTKLPAHQTPAGQLTPTTRSVKIAKENHRLPPLKLTIEDIILVGPRLLSGRLCVLFNTFG